MFTDSAWLATEGQQIHQIFVSAFYTLITVFFSLGIFVEYFKWPLGGVPTFSVFIGRALVAVILLHTYPEVMNTLANLTDALSQQLGDLNQFDLVLSRMGDKLEDLSLSWVSAKESISIILSFVTFFLLYISVHAIDAFYMFTWTLLFVFSPVLIALFALPTTAKATSALYRSLIEVSLWKVVWSVLATLLWSSALSKMNSSEDVNFVAVIFYNLILAGSLLMTPMVVHALADGGFAALAQSASGLVAGATMMAPSNFAKAGLSKAQGTYQTAATGGNFVAKAVSGIREQYFQKSGSFQGRSPKNSASPRNSSPPFPRPPTWHKRVPAPTEPPEWMKSKLEKEKNEPKENDERNSKS